MRKSPTNSTPLDEKSLFAPASYYAQLIPRLREIAAGLGYALTIHGSLTRDCDLVAIPWQEWAADSETLVKMLREETGGFFHSADPEWERIANNGCPTARAHGRISYSIHLTPNGVDGPYLDLSVMPLKSEDSADFLQLTTEWIKVTQARYKGFTGSDLTQVFMRGPFAGWSEHAVKELADRLHENQTKYPCWPKNEPGSGETKVKSSHGL